MKTIYAVCVWLVLAVICVNLSFELLTASNSLANITGFFLIITTVIVSYKTKCLTKCKSKKRY